MDFILESHELKKNLKTLGEDGKKALAEISNLKKEMKGLKEEAKNDKFDNLIKDLTSIDAPIKLLVIGLLKGTRFLTTSAKKDKEEKTSK